MNILFVYYYPSGGVETLARQRSYALKKHGVNFHFLYYRKGPGLQNIEETPTFITDTNKGIQAVITKGNYDVIIVCSDHSLLPRIRNMNFKGKLIYEVQGLGSFADAKKWLERAQPYVNKNADVILFPRAPHLINLIYTYYPSIRKYSFHNCIDTDLFTHKTRGPSEPNPIIGWVGRIEENKNWKGFLEIGYEMVKINSSIKLWMFIDATLTHPDQGQQFDDMLTKYQLNDNLKIFNNIPHQKMAEYYSIIGDSGGFLCSTSKVEGFGFAIVEAMSCRCPVLTTDSDGIKSFIFHNKTGKIYPHDNLQLAATEAQSLLFDNLVREKICLNAQKHIHTHFNPDTYANNFLNMLKDLGVYKA
ncbi:glycosyltransferase family 4 protein [Peribacillus sp. NPDC096622]|uniref:glycosyltransferase family 4 protein n=1 Tax=Peribacillus sp. NPDC096622 TaxID=3364396 RepID=UPI003823C3C4